MKQLKRIKKVLVIVLAVTLMVCMSSPAFASGGASVTTSMNGNNVTITVSDDSAVVASDVEFAKNSTQTYSIGGYTVEIVYNGGGVKSAKIIAAPGPADDQADDQADDPATTVDDPADDPADEPVPTVDEPADDPAPVDLNGGNNGNNDGSGDGNGNKNNVVTETEQTIYLKGSGSGFDGSGWQNIFYVGFENEEAYEAYTEEYTPSVWHLVYSGGNFNAITEMQIAFTNGTVFSWTPADGPSVNGGSNNMGWVIYAPWDWSIAYVNKGNNNNSDSFLVTMEAGNPQFNISGFTQGGAKTEPPEPPKPPEKGKIEVSVNVSKSFDKVFVQPYFANKTQYYYVNKIQPYYHYEFQKYFHNVTDKYYDGVAARYYTSADEKTLVSDLRGKDGAAFNNGHTYVKVDVKKAEAEPQYFGIADSSPSNRPIDYGYYVTIANDKLTVYFDDMLKSANVGAYVANKPNQFPGNAPAHYGKTVTVDMPKNYGDVVYLYFHNEGGIEWWLTKDYELTDEKVLCHEDTSEEACRHFDTNTIPCGEKVVGISYCKTAPKVTRIYGGAPTTTTKTIDVAYKGQLHLTVTDSVGNEVFNDDVDNFFTATWEGIVGEEYTFVLSGDGFDDITATATFGAEDQAIELATALKGETRTITLNAKHNKAYDKIGAPIYCKDCEDIILRPIHCKDKDVRLPAVHCEKGHDVVHDGLVCTEDELIKKDVKK